MFTDIGPGQKLVETIRRAISASRVLIVVIWQELVVRDGSGWASQPRPGAGLRPAVEIATALQQGLNLLPVLLPGAVMPRAEELPDDIAAVAHHQAREISDADFDHDVDSISGALAKALGASRRRRYLRGAVTVLAASTLIAAGAVGSYLFYGRSGSGSPPANTMAPAAQPRQDAPAAGNQAARSADPPVKPEPAPRSELSGGAPVVTKRNPEPDAPSSVAERIRDCGLRRYGSGPENTTSGPSSSTRLVPASPAHRGDGRALEVCWKDGSKGTGSRFEPSGGIGPHTGADRVGRRPTVIIGRTTAAESIRRASASLCSATGGDISVHCAPAGGGPQDRELQVFR